MKSLFSRIFQAGEEIEASEEEIVAAAAPEGPELQVVVLSADGAENNITVKSRAAIIDLKKALAAEQGSDPELQVLSHASVQESIRDEWLVADIINGEHSREAEPSKPDDNDEANEFLVLVSTVILPRGVVRDLTVAELELSGWVCFYDEPYPHKTQDSHLDACPPEATHILVAAKANATDATLAMAACGKKDIVLKNNIPESFRGGTTKTENQGDTNKGVLWYRWEGKSFGFTTARDPNLFLYYADSGCVRNIEEANSEDRLSWNLEVQSTGGWRAGEAINLGSEQREDGSKNTWRKVLYYAVV